MKVGETVWCEVDSFFDIREVKIVKETNDFFHFRIPEREKLVRRKKNRFVEIKEILIEQKMSILDRYLGSIKTSGKEIYLIYKEIYENNPEILL